MLPRSTRRGLPVARPFVLIAIALAGLLLAAGCSSGDGQPSAAEGSDVLAASTFEGEATTIEGQSFDLSTLADNNLVVWFWAPW